MIELFGDKGPVVNMRIMWSDLIFTSSPEHIKLILATDFNNYVKGLLVSLLGVRCDANILPGKRFHNTMFSVLGSGVFNSDGENYWSLSPLLRLISKIR